MSANYNNSVPVYLPEKNGVVYQIPFFILIFAGSIALIRSGSGGGAADLAFLSNPINLVILGFAYIVAVWLVYLNYRLIRPILGRNRGYFLSLLFILSTAIISNYPIKVVINFLHLFGSACAAMVAAYFFSDNIKKAFKNLSLFFALIMLAHVLTSIFFPAVGVHHKLHGRWMGLTSNPNTLGTVAFIASWVSFGSFYLVSGRVVKMANIITLIGSLLCLVKANCVTSSICVFILLVTGYTFMGMEQNKPIMVILKLFFMFLFFLLSLSVLWAFFPALLTPDSFFQAVGRDATMSGRTNLWAIGMSAFATKPLFGWGFDTNMSVLSRVAMEYGQFHNGYLNLAIAGGLCGVGFLLWMVARNCRLLWRMRFIDYRASVTFFILLLAIMIHDIAEASFYNPTNLIWIFFVFSFFYVDVLVVEQVNGDRSGSLWV